MAAPTEEDGLMAAKLAACFVLLHLMLMFQDIRSCSMWLLQKRGFERRIDGAGRLEAAMVDSRKANYFQFARCACFAGAGGVGYFIYGYYLNPSLSELSFVLTTTMMYFQLLAFATHRVELTAERARLSCACFYGLLAICYLELPFIEEVHIDAKSYDVQLTAVRFVLAAVAIDTRFSLPWQVLLSAGQLWADFNAPSGVKHPTFSIFLQLVVLGLTLLGSYTLETCVRSSISAQFHCSDAESLMFSFRRMLRGICDTEVLLDSNLCIHSVSDCLKHLLMTSTNLHGKSFQQLLDPDDLAKFKKFMKISGPATAQDLSTPPCLRVSLLGAANTRIPVDLFHVPVCKLHGSHDPYHLIALKEDGEPRAAQEASHEVRQAEVLGPILHRHDGSDTSLPSAKGLQGLFSELAELSLLVDASTTSCDVRQVNLRFQHSPFGRMPNLRSMVLPTEWDGVKDAVLKYRDGQEDGNAKPGVRLPAMRWRMMDSSSLRYNIAHFLELSPQRSPAISNKLWLRLGDLAEGNGCRHHSNFQLSRRNRQAGPVGH